MQKIQIDLKPGYKAIKARVVVTLENGIRLDSLGLVEKRGSGELVLGFLRAPVGVTVPQKVLDQLAPQVIKAATKRGLIDNGAL